MSGMEILAIVVGVVIVVGILAAIAYSIKASRDIAKEEKANPKPKPPTEAERKEKEAYKKAKKEREWRDINEDYKYVCQGGKIQCTFANPPIADIIVTSTTVMLQDKPWATVGDKDGVINFNFTGVCMHPSQQNHFRHRHLAKRLLTWAIGEIIRKLSLITITLCLFNRLSRVW